MTTLATLSKALLVSESIGVIMVSEMLWWTRRATTGLIDSQQPDVARGLSYSLPLLLAQTRYRFARHLADVCDPLKDTLASRSTSHGDTWLRMFWMVELCYMQDGHRLTDLTRSFNQHTYAQ